METVTEANTGKMNSNHTTINRIGPTTGTKIMQAKAKS